MNRVCSLSKASSLAVLVFGSLTLWAQRPQARLTGEITEGARAVLSHSRTPHADRGQDRGAVSPEMAVPGITLVFKRSATQQKELEDLLAAQQDKASPLYHHWLTPDTFAARFGVAEADIAATETWLRSHGFQIESAARGRDRITFSGTAAQVRDAFGTELHHYQVDGETHFAPATDLTLPAELAPMTAAVLHLSDFRPKPSVVAQSRPRPEFTSVSTQTHYLTPYDVLRMYGMTTAGEPSFQGMGQSIAIMGQSYVDTAFSSALSRFQSAATNGAKLPASVLVPGSGVEAISPGDEGESELDLEYSSGIAPQANIFFVYVGANRNYGVFDSVDFAIETDLAPVISISYGACEILLSTTNLNQENALFQQAAAQGQTVVAASGDSGSTSCADYPISTGVTAAQQQALAVTFPASSPYVTAVGGTEMAAGTFTAGASPYWSPASGVDQVASLLSYVPEVVWNEGTATRGIIATGGGVSGYFTRPSWQAGITGIPPGGYRLLPDIALQASAGDPGYVMCTSDPSFIGSQTSCTNGLLGSGGRYVVAGGTSFATPIFAGMVALLNQAEQTTGQGSVNPTLYTLASNPATYAGVFHDIISGTNACSPGAAACGAPGQSSYAATPGYDQATGLGSFDFGKLVAAWPASGTLLRMGTTVQVNVPSTTTPGTAVPIFVSVSEAGSTNPAAPSGTVSISVDGTVVEPSAPLMPMPGPGSQAQFTATPLMTAGSHIITVTYPGDGTYSPSIGSASVLVGNVVPSGTFSLSANNFSVPNGGTDTDSVTITPASGYSGRLTWALSASSVTNGGSGLTACYRVASPAVNGMSTATLTIGIGSACGSTASSGSVRTFVSRTAPASHGTPWSSSTKLGVYAGLLAFGLVGWRRKAAGMPHLFAAALFAILATGLAGCGGSKTDAPVGGTTAPPPVSAATVFTLNLKATDSINSSITASTTFTLTVN